MYSKVSKYTHYCQRVFVLGGMFLTLHLHSHTSIYTQLSRLLFSPHFPKKANSVKDLIKTNPLLKAVSMEM